MGKIVVSANITLDGVVQDPIGGEGFPRGGWFARISDRDREEWAKVEFTEALAAEAVLIGRRTYEWFAPRWASRAGDWAERLRDLPKYVVSSTALSGPDWVNSTVVTADEAAALKRKVAGDIVVYGSRQLVHTLIEHDLVDEWRLMTCPIVLGAGHRLFGQTDMKTLRLKDTRVVGDNLVLLTYEH